MTSWPQNAYVGQKVVYINNEGHGEFGFHQTPKVNQTYTIREILIAKPNFVAFRLVEIVNSVGLDMGTNEMGEPYFSGRRFRPAQSTNTGMSILKELLINPHKVLEDA